jgi:Mrp family chromosome partitioning ATPase
MGDEDAISSDELELFRDPATDVDSDDASSGLPAGRRMRKTSLIVVTGAKGGVGKSLLSANLAIYLATIGRKVVVVDADPTGANVHTFLGVSRRMCRRSLRSGVPSA